MAEKEQDRQNEIKVLLEQHSFRQAAANQQVLQALHQANEALQQARQLIMAEADFLQQLGAGFNGSKQAGGQEAQQAQQLPPWQLGQPPDLQ